MVGYIDAMNFYEASQDQAWYPAGWCNWTQTLSMYCPPKAMSGLFQCMARFGCEAMGHALLRADLVPSDEGCDAPIYFFCEDRSLRPTGA